MDWYYADAGKQIGPLDEAAFNGLVAAGTIRDGTLVWQAGMANWQPYQVVRPPPPLSSEKRFCSECGQPFAPDELVAFGNSLVCAACKPVFAQKLREGVRLPGARRYGGFWIRFAAVLLDGVLLYIVYMVLFGIAMALFRINFMQLGQSQADVMKLLALEGGLTGVNLVVAAAYETWMIGRYGATLGKMTCGLKVVMSGGSKVSYARALGRHFAKLLNSFTLGIGYIMAGIDDEKRGLHDRICETRVIHA